MPTPNRPELFGNNYLTILHEIAKGYPQEDYTLPCENNKEAKLIQLYFHGLLRACKAEQKRINLEYGRKLHALRNTSGAAMPRREDALWEDDYNIVKNMMVKVDGWKVVFCNRNKARMAVRLGKIIERKGLVPEEMFGAMVSEKFTEAVDQTKPLLAGADPFIAKALNPGSDINPEAMRVAGEKMPPGFGFGKVDKEALEREKTALLANVSKAAKEGEFEPDENRLIRGDKDD